ncbi:hypothetical protein CALCODRAFT_195613 [Calocera cornea HHB12733]|uniref:Uncharacterized protein n=1 Tax=Calocera cornea HHB12733 TaxID=1353952 RepID=A0A165HJC8_9BASI|nr:hypothetical protein CALCODRAFT_195613 [Calocera cornea HHB12733]
MCANRPGVSLQEHERAGSAHEHRVRVCHAASQPAAQSLFLMPIQNGCVFCEAGKEIGEVAGDELRIVIPVPPVPDRLRAQRAVAPLGSMCMCCTSILRGYGCTGVGAQRAPAGKVHGLVL